MLFRKWSLKTKPNGLRPSNLTIFFLIKCRVHNFYFRTNLSASYISRGDSSFDHPVLCAYESSASSNTGKCMTTKITLRFYHLTLNELNHEDNNNHWKSWENMARSTFQVEFNSKVATCRYCFRMANLRGVSPSLFRVWKSLVSCVQLIKYRIKSILLDRTSMCSTLSPCWFCRFDITVCVDIKRYDNSVNLHNCKKRI